MKNKRVFKGILAFLMLILSANVYADNDELEYNFIDDDICYAFTSSTSLEIVGFKKKNKHVVIPEKIKGYTVTAVGYCAFDNHDKMVSIQLPNTITKIGDYAFCECSKLKNINIPDGVTSIGECAFYYCISLKSIRLPKNLRYIAPDAFEDCRLTTVFNPSAATVKTNAKVYTPENCAELSVDEFEYTGLAHKLDLINKANEFQFYAADTETLVDAGEHIKYVDITFSNGDFSATFEDIPYKYTINKAPLTISVKDTISREYGENTPECIFLYKGFRNNENQSVLNRLPTAECDVNKRSDVGLYPIKISNAEGKNYDIKYEDGVLKITKATLTVHVKNAVKKYNEELPLFEVTFKGFKNDDGMDVLTKKPETFTKATKTSDVGTYEVKTVGGSAKNYNLEHDPGKLFVEKASQEITWDLPADMAKVGDSIRLDAVATSNLEITYLSDNDNMAEIVAVDSVMYLHCKQKGEVTVTAQQLGNKNYIESEVLTYTVGIQSSTAISAIVDDKEKVRLISLNGIKLDKLQKGVNIVRYGNGTCKKIYVK